MEGAKHRLAPVVGLAAAFALGAGIFAIDANAATPAPAANPDITLSAQPMLGGVVAPGAWLAVRVDVENSGPSVSGELRLAPASGQGSTYSLPVELASGARQEHFLYTEAGLFGSRFEVSLRSSGTDQATVRVNVDATSTPSRRIYVVAEHPERVTQPLGAALTAKGSSNPKLVAITPEDLPPRVEAWSSIDLLVWHDVDSSRLGTERAAALETWLTTGGNLLVFDGSLGATMFGGFPAGVLPYDPAKVIDVAPADIASNLGHLPDSATSMPAVTGPLASGSVLWQTANSEVIGARATKGQGAVVLVGLDPTTDWFAGSDAADALWSAAVPAASAWDATQLPADDGFLVDALGNLPAVQLPGTDQLLLLILAYVVAIGPVNYLLLKRRDRREWAWVTMPVTIGIFGIAAYGLGVALKGSSVIVSELAIVEAGMGSSRGEAEVHVGVFSPGRSDLTVKVGPEALVSAPSNSDGTAQPRPLDVVVGDPATVRNFGVNFGAMRSFKAQTAVDVPLLAADLHVAAGNKLEGTITNGSTDTLQGVCVVYASNAEVIGDLAPGETKTVSLPPGNPDGFEPLSFRLYPDSTGGGSTSERTIEARRAIVDHLAGGFNKEFFGGSSDRGIFEKTPVILAWATGPRLDIDIGTGAQHVGETAYVWPARVKVAGHVVFQGDLIGATVDSVESANGAKEGNTFYISRGTISVDYQPIDFDGTFTVSRLGLRLGPRTVGIPAADGVDLAPLPAEEQPDPNAPLASNPRPDEGSADAPRIQLFDRVAGTWVEFEPVNLSASYDIPDAARYVDASGAFRIRFVVRGGNDVQFGLSARLEGDVQ